MDKRSRVYFARLQTPVDIQVKWQIIISGGIVGARPETLDDNLDLTDDLMFDDNKYNFLCIGLKQIVFRQNPTVTLACTDVSNAATVGDCVKLVNNSITST